ncbi:tannase and feruloyl esterase [Aspergillus sclerotiicarbonarius CBS 121057]|uniref:Carboxylic ester hydrolase n=1 Tax=Aspergillus sclerotiicarbonarius (strain CBS 121057 / IBT 28362) TaxID=1448318 RepID=A0A319FMU1_ASPSB|nr:tannase and feruloyl esterase [Aspergillus sclerotiicarbonarius CBS 121057]
MLIFLVTSALAWLSSIWHPQKHTCDRLTVHRIPGVHILSIETQERHNYSFPAVPSLNPTDVHDLDFCDVTVTLTHPGGDDFVTVSIWLPLTDWNGRFQATGGGGLAAGYIGPAQAAAVNQGYVAASTDGGLTLNGTINPQTGAWALRPDGSLNTALLKNYAHRSIHDMTVIGKALTQSFYGTPPKFSYWNGCSTGGRQGYFAAALYPEHFDGILAGAPAINLPHLYSYLFWAPVLMINSVTPPQCVFHAFQKATIDACDPLDGAIDGLISYYDPETCDFGPETLIGETIECSELDSNITITSEHANLVDQIIQGPHIADGRRLWYGLAPGASFRGTADTITTNESTTPNPFFPSIGWTKNFVFQDSDYDVLSMDFEDFDTAALLSIARYTDILGSEGHYLYDFQYTGGKLLSWHGLADDIIPSSGTIQYRDRIEEDIEDLDEVDEFYRLFLAPGVGHCGGGYGPTPTDPFGALVRWVEEGVPPETLGAAGVNGDGEVVTRELCRYPLVLVYDGDGDVNDAGSFSCEYPEEVV